ncbi:MAG: NAD(P)-dependent alcohol dehydrogenase [Proteobacteria bacterium]|nr:NAD(P)-dependent alcohol dehydrogenase [Pseudomonadota bacterium]
MPMQAIIQHRYGTPDDLRLMEVEIPVPKPNEVLVKIHAAAVNDWELGLLEGKPLFMRLFLGLFRPKVKIMGCEIAGVIESVGGDIARFKPGDKVYGDLSASSFGAFAEYVCAREDAVMHMPSNLSFEQAAAIPHAAMLAQQALQDIAGMQQGQSLLINGAGGGVGTLAVQMAKLHKLGVTGVDSTAKQEYMTLLGFDRVIDYLQEDFTRTGKQYDLILDTKTSRSPFDYARALKPGGTYVTVGGSMPRVLQCLVFAKWISMTQKKTLRVLALKPNKGLNHFTGLIEAGKILPAIDSRFPLAEVPQALKHFASARHKGKVIISVASATDYDA